MRRNRLTVLTSFDCPVLCQPPLSCCACRLLCWGKLCARSPITTPSDPQTLGGRSQLGGVLNSAHHSSKVSNPTTFHFHSSLRKDPPHPNSLPPSLFSRSLPNLKPPLESPHSFLLVSCELHPESLFLFSPRIGFASHQLPSHLFKTASKDGQTFDSAPRSTCSLDFCELSLSIARSKRLSDCHFFYSTWFLAVDLSCLRHY